MHSGATIQCLNPRCQATNPLNRKSCFQCRTPLVKRYLRVIGEGIEIHQVGELISDRYLMQQPRTVLDTKPGLAPQVPPTIPDNLTPYLRLFPYRLHVPQIYGAIYSENLPSWVTWLLEYSTVPTDKQGELKHDPLLLALSQVWSEATALRQINWLWQIASLWQPLQSQGVASSLLDPSVLRTNGAAIALLELHLDKQVPTLEQLGQIWSEWISSAAPSIAQFLEQLCLNLRNKQISQPEHLLTVLEQGIFESGRSHKRSYQIFTCTDAGPSRQHNEDACYPPHSQLITASGGADTLAIVCDGIGGQEGGEIASRLAITMLQNQIKLALDQNPSDLVLQLEHSICEVNDLISQRNDKEGRYERQRMGTTLTMAIACGPEMYLSHVGDSRIYWITSSGCHQVTVDDDIASREARLGSIYRDVLREPQAGMLFQALGTNPSKSLHPTVQRLVLDEECVFLLCSDGLSDFDRVDQYWKREILPILRQETNVEKAARRLLEIANRQNGHDNVTVALVYCQVQPPAEPLAPVEFSFAPPPSSTKAVEPKTAPVQPQPSSPRKPRLWIPIAIAVFVLGLGAITFWAVKGTDEDRPRESTSSMTQLNAHRLSQS